MDSRIKDISASLWISASAGTGKTKSLIDRILALLLNGATPGKILCLTYTKAAASEMLGRLGKRIYDFHRMSTDDLKNTLENMGFSSQYSDIAKSLHEKSFNSSEWVQIKTIHAYCFGIIEKFPIETGLFPGVKLCDDHQRELMLNEAIGDILRDQTNHPSLELISNHTTNIFDIIDGNISEIEAFSWKFENFDALYADFFQVPKDKIFLENEELDQHLFNTVFSGQHQKIFSELAEILFTSEKKTDIEKAEILKANAINPTNGFMKAFLTDELTIRKNLCTQNVSKRHPDFPERMERVAHQALEFLDGKRKYISARANAAFFSIAKKIVLKFNAIKQTNHCIDFDDVIAITSTLLHNMEWVMYKNDGGIEHMLVDEAQDTSPQQWEIIKTITDEFFANGVSGKTVFVVGDEKQSIYSFQGADVKLFQQMHEYFKKRSESNGQKFHDIILNKSYRTTGNILGFVDDVFRDYFPNVNHVSARSPDGGVVEIVKLFESDEKEEEQPWEIATSTELPITSGKKLSSYIAQFIRDTIKKRVFVASKNRPAMASDFLLLFQRRKKDTMNAIVNALRELDIAATGIDKVSLKDELIVEDLVTFAEFAVSPFDDLACARVLKSPIIGITEDDLMNACIGREKKQLWNCLLKNNELCEKYSLKNLKKHLYNAFNVSAYGFFMNVLTDGFLEKFIARLGTKCLDVLYEFLDVVMEYENKNSASLQSFLTWFRSSAYEVKRESFKEENAVRMMTAHASKGLQAPFVILADCHFFRQSTSDKILKTEDEILFWDFSKDMRANCVENSRDIQSQLDIEESRRLLYVALTRSEDFLYIMGEKSDRKLNDNCWYSACRTGVYSHKESASTSQVPSVTLDSVTHLDSASTSQVQSAYLSAGSEAENGSSVMLVGEYSYSPDDYQEVSSPTKSVSVPDWFFQRDASVTLDSITHAKSVSSTLQEQDIASAASTYGDCVHLLLSEVNKYPRLLFDKIFMQLIDGFDLTDDLKNSAKAEVDRLLNISEYAFIFDENSMSEVPFIHNGHEGRIDKIAFKDPDEIWIIDFKTGKPKEEIPPEYAAQLSFYKEAVAEIFRDHQHKNLKPAILWTSASRLQQ
ncbi:DNA helicase [Alphaproteobacteria bacterium]|nr:DNA helicase [Alphaproteobacteria bacterium]